MAMPPVEVYQPAIKLTLFKTVGRTTTNGVTPVSTRFTGTAKTIDLTAWLSDASTIQIDKSIREPAGSFAINFVDMPINQGGSLETLYGLVEPMDFIEIRFQHGAPTGPLPPVIMRGFVSRIRRTESMSQDGRPQEMVIITGQDYGKIWQQLQVMYYPGYVIGEDILSNFKLFEQFGVGFETAQPVQQFVQQVFEKIVNPYLKTLMPANSPNPTSILLDGITVAHGTTSVSGPQNYQGTIYDILRNYGDVGIWNELFLEDRDDGVHLIFRPTPFLNVDVLSSSSNVAGNLIQASAGAVVPTITDVLSEDIVSLSVERSDANIANYYWVKAPAFDISTTIYQQLFAIQGANASTVLLTTYPNSAVNLYGIRVMQADTQLGADEVTTFSSGLPATQQAQRSSDMVAWIAARRAVMVAENQDNVVLESGEMTMRGNEAIRAGSYVRVIRGAFEALFYVPTVSQRFTPFGLVTSTLQLERGMGFVERIRMSSSPYLAERLGDLIGG